ncbi:response regulator transcription factor [Meridianimarinicoccus aquatilis]|uniref:Response regulator transcription factor n=1 Tax=Meridianimarinicoccus aquatilis TaxID=2552766 RepID=A0A4R6ARY6_9RHOB|nr:response regulator transcription factor [Fluviibacterium aquatile]QIE43606.1 response regulator transcription factor [Rhodobacteraceae bacterium SC52]TDL84543.1 response regulator transcription factor [Fluviibacterium aquatile]
MGDAQKIRILIADDHEMVLDMLRLFLEKVEDFEITTANTLDKALEEIGKSGSFSIVLLDYDMPGMNGLKGLTRCIEVNKPGPVALLTGNASHSLMQDVIALGAMGILTKNMSANSLENAIRLINSGDPYIPMSLMQAEPVSAARKESKLTDREMTVLKCLGEGWPNKEIAASLGLSEATIKMHVQSVCRKLDARNRTRAVINARDNGLL